ncbi:TraR/DksA family transcriptional regulator [Vibrio alginolyticus]|nr:TraR/DksA family transcriptional regulator [Vibrio alginolyticus]
MPDFIDHASSNETKFTEMAIANQLKQSLKTSERESAKECLECGDPIPEGRQIAIAGCQFCSPCQANLE